MILLNFSSERSLHFQHHNVINVAAEELEMHCLFFLMLPSETQEMFIINPSIYMILWSHLGLVVLFEIVVCHI